MIPHTKAATRDSNIELLRIIAMFMILALHADFKSLGIPSADDMHMQIAPSCFRIFIEALCVICVNVFVLISGWFGITPSTRGVSKLLFQCSFFFLGIYLFNLSVGNIKFNISELGGGLVLLENYWFIRCYLLLYIISPVLNTYVKYASEKDFALLLAAFFILQTVYGCSGFEKSFRSGYSTISFTGLYLLARYLKIYVYPEIVARNIKAAHFIALYIICSILISVVAFAALYLDIPKVPDAMFSYINPVVIVSSVCLLLAFSRLTIHGKFINAVGGSCLAVFLLHHESYFLNHIFIPQVNALYNGYSGVICPIAIGIFLLAVFAAAIAADRVRIKIWNPISRFLDRMSERNAKVKTIWNYKATIL